MDEILIQNIVRDTSGWTFSVEIGGMSDESTSHTVKLDDDYYERLTDGSVDAETLVEESFKFLLEREEKESIMPNFDLDIISNYFDDYERVISERVSEFKE